MKQYIPFTHLGLLALKIPRWYPWKGDEEEWKVWLVIGGAKIGEAVGLT